MIRCMTISLGLLLCLRGPAPACAADGTLDPAFGGDGRVTTAVGSPGPSGAWAVAVQPDGKIVAAGHTGWGGLGAGSFALARYGADGALDPTFGSGGTVVTAVPGTGHAQAVLVQPDGKIVAVGYGVAPERAVLIRYHPDGALDTTFGSGGIAEGPPPWAAQCAALLSDGKILVAGELGSGEGYQPAVARFNADGTLDAAFGTGGVTIESLGYGAAWEGNLVVSPDEATFFVSGSAYRPGPGRYGYEIDFLAARYLANGTLDPTFGTSGIVSTDFGTEYSDYELGLAAALQPDGRLVVAGPVGNFAGLVRYNPDGTLDPTFGTQGKVLLTQFAPQLDPRGLLVEPDGKLVVGGYAARGANGIDFGFASGPTGLGLTRLEPDGRLDGTFAPCPQVTTSFPGQSVLGLALARQPDGHYVIAGQTGSPETFAVARYGTPGSPTCEPAAPLKSNVTLRAFADDDRDLLTWKWTSPGQLGVADVGNPTSETGYTFCFAASGGEARGGPLRRDGWSAVGANGYRFVATGRSESSTVRAKVLPGGPAKGKLLVKAKGEYLRPGLPLTTPLTIRLVRDDAPVCWEATFDTHVVRNDAGKFVARSD